ncbi:peptidyl-tRNA hydrolase [Corynebacterium macginleyi]|uniref:peptidyl-tRNA hydrolase n=1 Tax=Corynebacterium macginleyi TaxID=38290 RepID=A0A3M0HMJ7_9CORY|nr:peptidyl-tRNA hydrolase [Corynebacterium macginleyi]MBK4143447.1 ACR protein [Corynebacterium macginleyi]MBK4147324.1 ACR protein [Corynebacterium macginleyi]MBK4157852.1 ACR protein [Corynebacterium macginleyi]MBK4161943.1 ACR protein [Corynebacterium macginleyi]MBK4165728.1 ACR protein [Corynebacterium macginleyi]
MTKFAIAHQRLVAACTARDSHEDPADPSTVQAMQIALHLPKQGTPARSEVLAAAARAVVAACLDDRAGEDGAFAAALAGWYGHRIRKIARRARNKAWRDVQLLPGVTVDDRARAFAPSAVGEVDPLINKLQIGHTDLAMDEPGPPLADAPIIYVDRSLVMTAGKAAAQVGHGSMMLAADMSQEEAAAWAAEGFPLVVREVDAELFRTACAQEDAVVIIDAGFTEIAPDSATVCALRRPIA